MGVKKKLFVWTNINYSAHVQICYFLNDGQPILSSLLFKSVMLTLKREYFSEFFYFFEPIIIMTRVRSMKATGEQKLIIQLSINNNIHKEIICEYCHHSLFGVDDFRHSILTS